MASASAPFGSGDEVTKKEKIRKGTTSCRECKRRKIRCVFKSPTDAICVGCLRRGTPCRSQELGDEGAEDYKDFSMRARLIRLENLVETLMERVPAEYQEDGNERESAGMDNAATYPQPASDKTPVGKNYEGGHPRAQGTEERSTAHTAQATFFNDTRDKYTKVQKALHDLLPPQRVADMVIGDPKANFFLQILCNPQAEVYQKHELTPMSSTLPEVTSHPVLLARKLLQLALCFQQLEPSFDDSLLGLREPRKDAMARYVNVVSDLVTSKDELVGSLEGMECLVLEGVFLINAGLLRRAWICVRRAVGIAQLMGIHRKDQRQLNILDPTTQATGPVIWSRIVYGERYLSLLLGTPTSIADNTFASDEKMVGKTPTERLDSIHAVISGLIIERNESDVYQALEKTEKVDNYLHRAARSVPPEWWQLPDFHQDDTSGIVASFLRAQAQIIHHNLLNILHLPYMLHNESDQIYEYSKSACVRGSREVLSRFISFRSHIQVAYCCRLVDFCAFTASTALLIAHISSDKVPGSDLILQRSTDRKLIEKALDTMDELNRINDDQLSKQSAEVARTLLAVESNSSDAGVAYSITRRGADTDHSVENHSFHLSIPYFGTIRLARKEPVRYQPQPFAEALGMTPGSGTQMDHDGLAMPLSSMGFEPSRSYQNRENREWPSSAGQLNWPEASRPLVHLPVGFQQDYQNQVLYTPGLIPEVDNWALQGVDTTFFDTLLNAESANQVSWDKA